MTKAELIARIAKEANISKAAAEKATDVFTRSVTKAKFKPDNLLKSSVK